MAEDRGTGAPRSPAVRRGGDLQQGLLRFVGALAAALVALLIMANILLLQLVDQGTSPKRRPASSAQQAGNSQLLPPPTTGTSNRAAASEADRLTRTLTRHLDGLQSQLQPLSAAGASLGSLPAATSSIAGNLQALATSGNVFGTQLQSTNGGIAITNGQLRQVVGGLDAMNGALGATNATIASVRENTSGLKGSLGTLNATIQSLRDQFQALDREFALYFRIYCATLTPRPSGCP
ncbi:MAG: hypothetical protein JOZ25_03010 [Actinobacteria bacterium]|nr:hypothetical protein [Actinomycetota bacterium]